MKMSKYALGCPHLTFNLHDMSKDHEIIYNSYIINRLVQLRALACIRIKVCLPNYFDMVLKNTLYPSGKNKGVNCTFVHIFNHQTNRIE